MQYSRCPVWASRQVQTKQMVWAKQWVKPTSIVRTSSTVKTIMGVWTKYSVIARVKVWTERSVQANVRVWAIHNVQPIDRCESGLVWEPNTLYEPISRWMLKTSCEPLRMWIPNSTYEPRDVCASHILHASHNNCAAKWKVRTSSWVSTKRLVWTNDNIFCQASGVSQQTCECQNVSVSHPGSVSKCGERAKTSVYSFSQCEPFYLWIPNEVCEPTVVVKYQRDSVSHVVSASNKIERTERGVEHKSPGVSQCQNASHIASSSQTSRECSFNRVNRKDCRYQRRCVNQTTCACHNFGVNHALRATRIDAWTMYTV